jgi:trimeric autotransporter adhesin
MNVRGRTGFAGAVLAVAGLVGGLAVAAPPVLAAGSPGIITTVAGGPGRGPATNVNQEPDGLAAGPDGALYVGDEGVVRELSTATSWERVFAGVLPVTNSDNVFSGGGGPALKAWLNNVTGLAVDAAGNVVITDEISNRVLVAAASTGTFYGQAMKAGHIYSVAGDGDAYYSGDGGPATSAGVGAPMGVAVDTAGNLVIATQNRLRVVAASTGTFYGRAMTAGDIYTVAGDGVSYYNGDGIPATSAGMDPYAVAVDAAGNLVIADYVNSRVRVVAASTGTFYGQAMTAGDVYTVAGDGTLGDSGDGGPATSAELGYPVGVAVDAAGNLVIADTTNDRVRVVAAKTGTFYGQAVTAGDIYSVAGVGIPGYSGNGGRAASAALNFPVSVAFDGAGNLVIADNGNGRVRVVAAKTGTFYGQAMTARDIYTVAGNSVYLGSGSGGPAVNAELGLTPFDGGVAVDSGNYVVVQGFRAWFICRTAGTYFGRAMKAGDIYTVAGDGMPGYSGNGGPATSAKLDITAGVAVDKAGNLVITDALNNRVRVVAASTGTFYGQAMKAGDIYTVAGNGTAGYSGNGRPATSAKMNIPEGVAVDAAGNLVITDSDNNRVRVVAAKTGTFYGQAMTGGDIYTVAGNGTEGSSGDGVPATSAYLYGPHGVTVDGAGNLVIADTYDNLIQVVATSTGTFYGQAMTAGDIYTVAGNGTEGYSGDGGPATSAELDWPYGVAVDGSGNLVISDTENGLVRLVSG